MQQSKRVFLCLMLGLSFLVFAARVFPHPTHAQVDAPASAFNLRAGVVVDRERSALYMMNPGGGIDAVDISSGRLMWHTDRAAKPLRIFRDLLIAQAEKPEKGRAKPGSRNRLEVVLLDASDGVSRLSVDVELPEGAWSSIDDGPGVSLKIDVTVDQGDVIISWSADVGEMSGMAPRRSAGANDTDALSLSERRKAEGAVRIDLQAGRALPLTQGAVALQQAPRLDAPDHLRIPDLPGEQYLSADGRHVLVSESIGDDTVWEKYRWTIYSLATKERIGEITNHFPRASFFISGSSLIYQSQPFTRRVAGRLTREPLKLRALDLLRGGAEVWVLPLRDTAYRGPFPA